ncbi:MAG: hypothetical protein NT031_20245, partial [Planctomycetota bacterium]|nr:hypothetical protein [Planctomycetota bacterium]
MTGMRILASAVVIGLPLLGIAPGQEAPTRPAAPESPAAASLTHSAYHLKFLPDAPARQYRLRALAMAAAERDPASPQAADLLALIYRSSPDPAAPLAETLEKTLAPRPNDFGLAWQWLSTRLARTHTARERIALLTATAQRADLGADLRAEAAAQAGLVLEREGEGDKARALFAQALSLDPWNALALARPDALGTDPAAQVGRYVRLLQGTVAETTGELGPVA